MSMTIVVKNSQKIKLIWTNSERTVGRITGLACLSDCPFVCVPHGLVTRKGIEKKWRKCFRARVTGMPMFS